MVLRAVRISRSATKKKEHFPKSLIIPLKPPFLPQQWYKINQKSWILRWMDVWDGIITQWFYWQWLSFKKDWVHCPFRTGRLLDSCYRCSVVGGRALWEHIHTEKYHTKYHTHTKVHATWTHVHVHTNVLERVHVTNGATLLLIRFASIVCCHCTREANHNVESASVYWGTFWPN